MNAKVFARRIDSVLKDNAINRYVSNKKKGDINNRRLYKIAFNDKIFKKVEERMGKDYSVTILLDTSGSMDEMMGQAVLAINEVVKGFEFAKIPVAIYAFNTVTRKVKSFDSKFDLNQFKILVGESQHIEYMYCPKCMYIDSPTMNCPECGTKCRTVSGGGTDDAPALHIAYDESSKVSKRNILLVITDGVGMTYSSGAYDDYHIGKIRYSELRNASTVLKKIRRHEESLIAIAVSIGHTRVKQIYGDNYAEEIESPNEILDAVSKLLTKHIRRA